MGNKSGEGVISQGKNSSTVFKNSSVSIYLSPTAGFTAGGAKQAKTLVSNVSARSHSSLSSMGYFASGEYDLCPTECLPSDLCVTLIILRKSKFREVELGPPSLVQTAETKFCHYD